MLSQDHGRAEYVAVTDEAALRGSISFPARGFTGPGIPHAVVHGYRLARRMRTSQAILINLSGRGDKDIHIVASLSGEKHVAH
jgi:tryptophan synthase beta chain